MTTLIMHPQEQSEYMEHPDSYKIKKYKGADSIGVICEDLGRQLVSTYSILDCDSSGLFKLSELERLTQNDEIILTGGLFERSIANAFYRIKKSQKFQKIILPKDAVFSAGPWGSRNLNLNEVEAQFNEFYKDVLEYVFQMPYTDKHDKLVFAKTI